MLDLAGFMVGAVDDGGADFRIVPHHHYASYPWWSETTQAVLSAMRDEVQPGMRVLDFGCGASAILSLASASLGAAAVRSGAQALLQVITTRASE